VVLFRWLKFIHADIIISGKGQAGFYQCPVRLVICINSESFFLLPRRAAAGLPKPSREGVLLGKESSAAHVPNLLRLEKRTGDELFKKLADLFE